MSSMATRPSTTIAVNDGPPQPGYVEIEYEGRRYWYGHVTGIHEPGDHATITVHVGSDPETVLIGKAMIKAVRFPEDGDPVTEFIGEGPLDRKESDRGVSADPLGLTPEQRAMSRAAELWQAMPENYRRNIEQIRRLPAGTVVDIGGIPTVREALLARLGEDHDETPTTAA